LSSPSIVIIDYGVGNLNSILNAFFRLNYFKASVSRDFNVIANADGVILPGVGAFGYCSNNLKSYGLIPVLDRFVLEKKKPVLGICVGMQLFAANSEENPESIGLGWIPGNVVKISSVKDLKIPHVGWNDININYGGGILKNSLTNDNFYFDHSYYLDCPKKYIQSSVSYGNKISASISFNNIFGVQFHPEKSQNNGLRIFNSFAKLL